MSMRPLHSLLLVLLLPVVTCDGEETASLYITSMPMGKGMSAKNGLYVSQIDAEGKLSEAKHLLTDQAAMTVDRRANGGLVYTAGKDGGLLAVDRATGEVRARLGLANLQSCYVSTNPDKSLLFIASIGTGQAHIVKLAKDGTFAESASFTIPKAETARKSSPHCVEVSPDGKFLFVADIAGTRVVRLRIDAETPALTVDGTVTTERMEGPRHLTFDAEGKRMYLVNQMGEAVTVFNYTAATGALVEVDHEQTVPDDQLESKNHIAEIEVHPSGKFVYVSNRGHDSIALLRRNTTDGTLTFVECVSSGGEAPWAFTIHPDGRTLYCSNRKSDNVRVYRIEAESGKLTFTGQEIKVPAPRTITVVAPAG
jgi:6-phosphogluconolactonase